MVSRNYRSSIITVLIALTVLVSAVPAVRADLPSVLIVAADSDPPTAELMATGRFSTVNYFDARSATPSLPTLSSYDAVLAYTNSSPYDATALGDVLADYVDSGGRVNVLTYSFSTLWEIKGRIMTSGYSPLTNIGTNGDVSGKLVATTPDQIFEGIDLSSVTYFHNSNFAHPGIDAGATLLATDGSGINMIAVNSERSVVALNLFPGTGVSGNNAEFYKLLANSLILQPMDYLKVEPLEGFTSLGNEGGPFTPLSKTYTLTNTGPNSIDWAIDSPDWLNVKPNSGTLQPSNTNMVVVFINKLANDLDSNIYTSEIIFHNLTSGVDQSYKATLEVLPAGLVFYDYFPTTTLNPVNWSICAGQPTIDNVGLAEPSEPYSLRLNGNPSGGDCVESQTISLSEQAELTYWYEQTGGGENPDSGEDLVIEYWNGTSWVELERQFGDGPDMTNYVESTIPLPPAAIHDNFKLRISSTGTSGEYDDWFVDDVYIRLLDDLTIAPMEGFSALGYEGGPFEPNSKDYTLGNTGPASLEWAVDETCPWLDLEPNGGILLPGDNNMVVVFINELANDLDPDIYTGETIFHNLTSGVDQSREATLEVLPIPGEIEVTDTIPPPDDLNLPFGDVFMGLSRTEKITIANTDPTYELIVTDISIGGEYLEDFEDGLAQDWNEDLDGNWEVVSGEYRAQSGSTDFMFSRYLGQEWENLSVQMSCRRDGDIYTSACVLLRTSSDFDDGVGSGYVFQLATDGDYSIWKQVSGSWSWLQSWTYSSAINSGTNVLTASAEGNQLKFLINGTLVWSGTDNDLTSGHIGLGGYTEPGYDTSHYFDDVLVTEPITDTQTISAEQKWYNEHPYEGGTPEFALYDWKPPKYPGKSEVSQQFLPKKSAKLLARSSFRLENVPSLPITILPLDSIDVNVIFEPMEVEECQSTVVINSNDADEPEIEVQLSGMGIPEYLVIAPEEDFEFSGHPGGPFVPSKTYYQLTNTGPVGVDWIAEPNVPWLDAFPSGGILNPGGSTTVIVTPNSGADTMPEGYHCGDLIVTDITTTAKLKRRVCLNVYTAPKIWTTPYSFSATDCQGDAQTQILTISNGGDGDLNFSLSGREIPGYLPAAKTTVTDIETSEDKIVLEYEFNEPIIYEGDEYDSLIMEGLEQYLRVGAPVIPVRPVKILVPFGKKVLTTRTIPLETYDLPGLYQLPPAQKPNPLSYQGTVEPTKPDMAIYGKPTPWPGIDHEEVTVQSKRGYQLFIVNLFPMQYVPTTGKISYAGKLRLEIDLVDVPTLALRPSDTVEAELLAAVDNPAVLETYPESDTPLETLGQPKALPPGGPYQYVIITNETLEAAPGPWNFQAICDAKIARGMTATIVTTSWIYANYDGTRPDGGSDNQTRIRNFLIDAYETWGTEYVLLGGNANIIPARMFFVDSLVGDIDEMPVDMYYGCVDPPDCSFDYNADGWYGEPTDGIGGGDVDLLAEIYVGRAPVENITELQSFIKKTLTYDSAQNEYLSRISMLGEYLGFGGVAEYAKDSKEQIRLGGEYDGYFTYGFENQIQSSFIDIITEGCLPENPTCCWPLYDKDSNWYISELLCLMNGGIHAFNHLGHADYDYCMKLDIYDLSSLINTDYFLVYSQGCFPGAFDISNCFAEVITSMEHGAFAVVMNARYGYGTYYSTDGPSNRFDRQFWDAALGEGILELGRANQDSKEDNLWDINGECIRWCYYELNLFGDPAQRLRLTKACDWIEFVPEAGTVAPDEAIDVNVVFTAEGAPGTHRGEIAILSNDPYMPEITIPVMMIVEPIDHFTELFEPGDPFNPNDPNRNDMMYRTLTFRPDSSCSKCNLCINDAVAFPVDPNGGTIVSLKDDDYIPVNLKGARINFYGTDYDTFYIGSNGYISFITGDIRYFENLSDHFDVPRISALFDDLDPSAGGLISWKQLNDRVVVTFENVPEYGLYNSNSFQIEMRFNGKIRITFLDIAAKDGLVGLSEGYGLAPWFTQSDLSEFSLCSFVGDLNGDLNIDFTDFAMFAVRWLETSCGMCGGADLTGDGNIDFADLKKLAENWLAGI